MADVFLEARNVVKRYGATLALDHVDVKFQRGAVNVLIGENGAGKSTLMRMLAGIEQPDSGGLFLEGQSVAIRNPREAAALGISIVHQELSVLPNMDISENIFAGRELTRAGMVERDAEDRAASSALRRLRSSLAVQTPAAQLSLGSRQLIEVARTVAHGARLLILDEPTSALSIAETDVLFGVVDDLRREGVTIVYISHRLHELMHLGDYFTVLRSGRVVGEGTRGEVTRQWIVVRMSGRTERDGSGAGRSMDLAPPALEVTGLTLGASVPGESAQAAIADVNFTVRRGETLAIYGLLGAGRTEILEMLAGVRRPSEGRVCLNGKALRGGSVSDAIDKGIALVPEDRQRDGLVPELSIRENIALAWSDGPFVSRSAEAARVGTLIRKLNIAPPDMELPVSSLSGGNQQKVLIARCLLRNPRVLLLDEPTRGVDAGAKMEIYDILRDLAGQGLSVVFASSEIEETQALADRAVVLCQGRIAAEFDRSQLSDDALFAAASPTFAPGVTA